MPRVLFIGNFQNFHVGYHFREAAKELGHPFETIDIGIAYEGGYLPSKFNWHVLQHRPVNIAGISRLLLEKVCTFQPTLVLSLGFLPCLTNTLLKIRTAHTRVAQFLTDDPFNFKHGSARILESIRRSDLIFTPRKSNIEKLRKLGCQEVHYLPFGYNPAMHFQEERGSISPKFQSDVLFFGGADDDRIPYMREIIRNGFSLALCGGYWDCIPNLKPHWKGNLPIEDVRKLVANSKITLNLVRHDNQDGHTMRSFEAVAMGGCVLMEDTEEHREIFGDSVPYFDSGGSMIRQIALLTQDAQLREHFIATSTKVLSTKVPHDGKHTYRDRLISCLQVSK